MKAPFVEKNNRLIKYLSIEQGMLWYSSDYCHSLVYLDSLTFASAPKAQCFVCESSVKNCAGQTVRTFKTCAIHPSSIWAA